MTDQFTRLQGVLLHSLARKPRSLKELAADMPGDWTVRQISDGLLELREAGYVRFQGGVWRAGAEQGKVGHCDVVVKGTAAWDAAPGPGPGCMEESDRNGRSRFTCMWGF